MEIREPSRKRCAARWRLCTPPRPSTHSNRGRVSRVAQSHAAPAGLDRGIFAGAALLLAAIGVYGVVAGCVADRRLEIGIRIALGAKPGTVLAKLLGGTIRLTLTGVAAGIALSSALVARGLESVLFGVRIFDPVTYATSGTALNVVAAVSAWLPARKAASLDAAMIVRREN